MSIYGEVIPFVGVCFFHPDRFVLHFITVFYPCFQVRDCGDSFEIHTRSVTEHFIRTVLGKCKFKGEIVTVLFVEQFSTGTSPDRSAPPAASGPRTYPPSMVPRGPFYSGGSFTRPIRPPRPGPPRPPHRPLPHPPVFRVNAYNQLTRLLVISHFRDGVLNLSGTAGVPPFQDINYNEDGVMKSLLFCIKKECAGVCCCYFFFFWFPYHFNVSSLFVVVVLYRQCEHLILDNNHITTILPLESLSYDCPSIRFVSLKNNLLSGISGLEPLVKLKIRALNIAGNPFCEPLTESLVSQLRVMFKNLRTLDGMELSGPSPAPAGNEVVISPAFVDGDSGFMNSLVKELMLVLDSRSLEQIKKMYMAESTFTLSASKMGRTRFPPELFSLTRKELNEHCNVLENVFCGPDRIYSVLGSLPPMEFDQDKMYFDSIIDQKSPSVCGVFISGTMNFKFYQATHLFSFSRSTYVAHIPGEGVKVVSDHITFMPFHGGPATAVLFSNHPPPSPAEITEASIAVRTALEAQAEKRAQAQAARAEAMSLPQQQPAAQMQPSAQVPSVPQPVMAVEDEEKRKNGLIDRLSQETNLRKFVARQCLESAGWNYDGALENFRKVNSAQGLSSNQFINRCSDQDVCYHFYYYYYCCCCCFHGIYTVYLLALNRNNCLSTSW